MTTDNHQVSGKGTSEQCPRSGTIVEQTIFHQGVVVAVDKPLGWTSFDVVNKFRYLLSRRLRVKRIKVGHAGTLDPLATGIVLLCTGRKTRDIEALMGQPKVYDTTLYLGATTPSYDMETEVDARYSTEDVTESAVRGVLRAMVGEIDQVPPLYSAVKVDGKRAYDHARRGDDIALPPKRVVVYGIELLSLELPYLRLRISCGRGTYIRAIARDLGQALGCGAYLTELRRTVVGQYTVQEAIAVEDFGAYIEEQLAANASADAPGLP